MGFLEVGSFAALLTLGGIYITQVKDMQWEILSTEFIGHSHIEAIHPLALGAIRAVFAISVWAVIIGMVTDKVGLTVTVLQRNNTPKAVKLIYLERLTAFTVWSWILQGFYFTLASYCSIEAGLKDVYGSTALPPMPIFLQRLTWVLFEISFPVAFLVSLVVTFVLIPGAKKNKMPLDLFFSVFSLMMHNCNIWYMAFEFIANQLPFVGWHVCFLLFYALSYAVFSWFWHYYKGIYYYFFLDYERPGAIFWYIGLVVGVSLLFAAGYGCAHLQYNHSHTIPNLVSRLS